MTEIDPASPRVCIVGMGYVGLTLAGALGEVGVEVLGVDRNAAVVETLGRGRSHLHEVGLEALLGRLIGTGLLRFSTDIAEAGGCSVFIIAVGTPIGSDGAVDLSALSAAVSAVAAVMPAGALVVLRSTVRVGVTRGMVNDLLSASGKPFDLSFCPERTIEGRALEELRRLPQIISGLTDSAVERSSRLFSLLTPAIVRVSSVSTAEVIKLVDNTSRDIGFAIANEVALFCDQMGIDAIEVIRQGSQGYERVSLPIPGPVGGPCLSKDPYIFVQSMTAEGRAPALAAVARAVNRSVPEHVAEAVGSWRRANVAGEATRPRVALLGMAFKGRPETDDLRGSTTLDVRNAIEGRLPGTQFVAWDPVVGGPAIETAGVIPVTSLDEAFDGADVIVIANNHPKWSTINLSHLAVRMRRPGLIYDLWNNFERRTLRLPDGITYLSLGRHFARITGGAPS